MFCVIGSWVVEEVYTAVVVTGCYRVLQGLLMSKLCRGHNCCTLCSQCCCISATHVCMLFLVVGMIGGL